MADPSDEFRRFFEKTVALDDVLTPESDGSFDNLAGRVAGHEPDLTLWMSAGIVTAAAVIALISPRPDSVGGTFWRAGRDTVQGFLELLQAVSLPLVFAALLALLVAAVAHRRAVPAVIAAGEPFVAAVSGGVVGLLWIGVVALAVINLVILALIVAFYVGLMIFIVAGVLGALSGLVSRE
jgi:hypothetical protein